MDGNIPPPLTSPLRSPAARGHRHEVWAYLGWLTHTAGSLTSDVLNTTVHSCGALLLSTPSSLPCVRPHSVHTGHRIHCAAPFLLASFLLSVPSSLLMSPVLLLHHRLRSLSHFPSSPGPCPLDSYVADPSLSSSTNCCSIGLGSISSSLCNFRSLLYFLSLCSPYFLTSSSSIWIALITSAVVFARGISSDASMNPHAVARVTSAYSMCSRLHAFTPSLCRSFLTSRCGVPSLRLLNTVNRYLTNLA